MQYKVCNADETGLWWSIWFTNFKNKRTSGTTTKTIAESEMDHWKIIALTVHKELELPSKKALHQLSRQPRITSGGLCLWIKWTVSSAILCLVCRESQSTERKKQSLFALYLAVDDWGRLLHDSTNVLFLQWRCTYLTRKNWVLEILLTLENSLILQSKLLDQNANLVFLLSNMIDTASRSRSY